MSVSANAGPGQSRGNRARRPWKAVILGGLAGVVIAAGAMLIVGAPLIVGHRADLPLERWYGNAAVSIAARFGGANQSNPLANNPRVLSAGRNAYTGSCASCHGATGDGKGIFGQATYPPATDLTTHDAKEKSDGQLYWIIKNGLSFTAMPGNAGQYNDQEIWGMVSYVRALQQGNAGPAVTIPEPTMAQLDAANPAGDAVGRGAAVYFAQGCQSCHGAVGNAPGELGLRGSGETGAIRRGRPGMPAYGTDMISNAQLADMEAYMATFSANRGGRGSAERERD